MPLPDIDSLDTLGGELTNYAPVEDPTTDLDASADNATRCDVAMLTQTGIRAWCRFTGHATTPTRVAHAAMWGSGSGVAPTVAHSATGTYTITYTSTQSDELGDSHTLNFRAAWGNCRSASVDYTIHVVPTSANVLTAYVFNSAGALNDAAGVDFDVFTL